MNYVSEVQLSAVQAMAQSARMLPCHHAVGALVVQPYRSCHRRFLSLQARSSLFDSRTGAFDPGNWVFSPEWWGTQGRGWGRNLGNTVFEQPSEKGNGLVSVTAHPASSSGLEDWPELSKLLHGRQVTNCEWRVLRFNHETRQSVAKIVVVEGQDHEEPYLMQIPGCLAFEWKTKLDSNSCGGIFEWGQLPGLEQLGIDGFLSIRFDGINKLLPFGSSL
ncbi:hypothetical protein L7F22_023986 [Adiantum nelumboides]|nr:hypothetical protein [Adiantum nelumboides]